MVQKKPNHVKLEANNVYAWMQCHPRASLWLIGVGLINILLNLADLFLR